MEQNRLHELPLAQLSNAQLQQLKQAEEQINSDGQNVYLIAYEKQAPSR
ncbi:hypothetical protein [Brevibacillus centrosporus]|jgi:hypothetical protein|uniref:Uncharacterized protein n=1 Tax=Brevibacillus centrosporus TaxID=54910 RepID=A0A1I3VVZ1_9BACL|nr:hypothetical protein [Brevibacillus centrosporus]MEC2130677.1 hypothetical protein [Brevibacillus centrosporus]MED1954557.1 hypothetical protein [Brevibacillus centrosporus]MED4908232.1 hypothetical protein [Brevibacillus centrosporus]SFJ99309.1 hypothetical protein SAMN05518846_107208 [Brevibacillus centrosporus]GED33367.1 hypothetical protein BCE02nite_45080 [Brevibacillus centrosporus]